MTLYNKLVRDKVPAYLDSIGVPYEERIADDFEYEEELIKKLEEEVEEFMEIKNSEELADIIEVIEALKKLPSFQNTEEVRKEKKEKKGGFDCRIILKGEK